MQSCAKCGEEHNEAANICHACVRQRKRRLFVMLSAFSVVVIIAITAAIWFSTTQRGERTYHEFDAIYFVSDGLAVVRRNRRIGIIDMYSGRAVIPFGRYDGRITFTYYGNLLHVRRAGYDGVVNIENGDEIIPFSRYSVTRIRPRGDMAIVRIDKRDLRTEWYERNESEGLIDITSGEELIAFGAFDAIWDFYDGIAIVSNEVHVDSDITSLIWGVIDIESGDEIIPFGEYDRFSSPIYDGMVVARRDEYVGLIELETQRELIRFGTYDWITLRVSEGIAIVEYGEYEGIVCLATWEEIVPIGRFHSITPHLPANIAFVTDGESVGVVDFVTLEEIIPFCYEYRMMWLLTNDTVIAHAQSVPPLYDILNLTNGKIIRTFSIEPGFTVHRDSYSAFMHLSNGLSVVRTNYIQRYSLIDIVSGEKIIPPMRGAVEPMWGIDRWSVVWYNNLAQLLRRTGHGTQYPIYEDGFIAVTIRSSDGVIKRGLIETSSREEIIPIIERDIRRIRPLPGGFVALQQHNGGWRIECVETVRLNYAADSEAQE